MNTMTLHMMHNLFKTASCFIRPDKLPNYNRVCKRQIFITLWTLAQVPQPHIYHPSINPRAGSPLLGDHDLCESAGTSRSDLDSENNGATASSSRSCWSSTEARCVIESVKNHYQKLTTTKSSVGKSSVWKSIFKEFEGLCAENGVDSTKTVMQVKDKWRALLDRYKAVCDHNKQTGRDPKKFEFYFDIDEFMHNSDKVHPKFVKETGANFAKAEESKKQSENNTNETGDRESSHDPTHDPSHDLDLEDKMEKENDPNRANKNGKRPAKSTDDGTETAKKKKSKSTDGFETEWTISKMLENQQKAIERAELQDKKHFEALMKYQHEAEERHNNFVVSVLGKLGELFSKK